MKHSARTQPNLTFKPSWSTQAQHDLIFYEFRLSMGYAQVDQLVGLIGLCVLNLVEPTRNFFCKPFFFPYMFMSKFK